MDPAGRLDSLPALVPRAPAAFDGSASTGVFSGAFLRLLQALEVAARRGLTHGSSGRRRSIRPGGSLEFSDYRPYSVGDDVRAVDWSAYARLEQLFVKVFAGETDLAVHLLIDASASMGFGVPQSKLLLAQRLGVALAYVALARLDCVSVSTFGGGRLTSSSLYRGKRSIALVLDQLARVELREGPTGIGEACRGFCERHPRRGVTFLLTDLLDPGGFEAGLRLLHGARHEPRVIQIVAREELTPSARGGFRLHDAGGEGEAVAVSLDDDGAAQYVTSTRLFLRSVEAFCHAHRIPYVRTESDVEIGRLLVRLRNRPGFLR
ncbi:DUF58 domain-containing protein [Planctomycetota bacterium]